MKKKYYILPALLVLNPVGYTHASDVPVSETEENYTTTAENDNESSPFVINEIQAANIDQFIDPSCNFGGWIELYNPNPTAASLEYLYISDAPNDPFKSKLISDSPKLYPRKYKVFWFGYNIDTPSQINFNLNPEGGMLYISDGYGKILTQQNYPPAVSRTSYARTIDGGKTWGYTADPTPKGSNKHADYTSQRLSAPVIDTDSRLFTESFDIHVTIPEGATLRYTLDGSVPTKFKGKTHKTGDFHIDQTTILRCRLFEDGKLPSPVVTRSFIFKDKEFDLPVISLVTDSRYLYDDKIGIFVRGTNGKPGNGQSSACNWNMDWDRPANIEYFTTDGKVVVNQETNLAVSGGWSRASEPKSFKVKAKKKYDGKNFIPYSVFPSKPFLKQKTWQVRNGGNDLECRIKDAALQEMVLSTGMNIDGQACQPVVHYINGKYIGMLNVREPNNKDFAYANFGWDDDEIDHFNMGHFGYWQNRGTDEAFLKWHELSAHAASPEVYKEILNYVDVDEFINYMAVHMYLGCGDYGKNNVKAFRPRIENGRFRFMLHDLDSSFGHTDSFDFLENMNYYSFHEYGTDAPKPKEEIKFITIFFNMLKNEEFRKQFIDTYCLVRGSIFVPERCDAIVDSLVQQRALALSYENKSSVQMGNEIKSSIRRHQQQMITTLKTCRHMHLAENVGVNVTLASSINKGKLSINDVPVPTNQFYGDLFYPVTLHANTPAGYRFIGWAISPEVKREYIFKEDSYWNYYDQGSLDGTDWKTTAREINWRNAKAPMGFNTKHPEIHFNTILDFGGDEQNKRPTYYFYRDFMLDENPTDAKPYTLHFSFDDGIVIYINGKEFTRELMPSGEITYNTFATSYAGSEPTQIERVIPAEFLKKGRNRITVEVHNIQERSSDIYFSAQLYSKQQQKPELNEFVSTDENFTLPVKQTYQKYNLTACFEPISEADRNDTDCPVVINEISAYNSIFMNDYSKKKDWIELYNTTDEPIELEGMYLSDTRQHPKKFCISSHDGLYNTQIEPHGYKLLWADGLLPSRDLHTNFSLSKLGGEVILTAADETWADTLIYESHPDKHTIGRYPDGNARLYVMSLPTINASNQMTTYTKPFIEPEFPTDIEDITCDKEDWFTLHYTNRKLDIDGQVYDGIQISIYHINGSCLLQQKVDSNTASISLSHLSQGTYIARGIDAQGHQQVIKFIVTE